MRLRSGGPGRASRPPSAGPRPPSARRWPKRAALGTAAVAVSLVTALATGPGLASGQPGQP
ncbi:MAG: hypothetical protein ACRD0L_07620, partial [Acidimicrobiales bacterium]